MCSIEFLTKFDTFNMKLIIVLSIVVAVVIWAEEDQSCQGQNDCSSGECCTIPEGGRKPNATCQKKAGMGGECFNKPFRLGPPENGHDNMFFVYGRCNCTDGLECDFDEDYNLNCQ